MPPLVPSLLITAILLTGAVIGLLAILTDPATRTDLGGAAITRFCQAFAGALGTFYIVWEVLTHFLPAG